MREIISIDKDYKNNTVKEYKTLKPNSNIKGKVTISLLDENNVVREIYTENAIMDITKYTQYLGYVNIGTGNFYSMNNWYLQNMSDTIYLLKVDDNFEVNPKKCNLNNWEKEEIGYCGKHELYSGEDTKKGTYNKAESKIYIDDDGNIVYHFVYDFPTHSANGTINAIGFGASSSPSIYGVFKNNETSSNLEFVCRNGEVSNQLDVGVYMYTLKGTNTGFNIYRYNKYNSEKKLIKEVITKDTKGYQTYRFNSTKKYIVGILFTDKENMIIQKFDLLGELISEETVSITTLNGGTQFIRAILDEEENYLYVYDYVRLKVYDVKNNYTELLNMLVYDDDEEVKGGSSYSKYRTIHVDDNYIMLTYLTTAEAKTRKYLNKKDFSLVQKASRTDSSIYYHIPIVYNNNTTIFSDDYGRGYTGGRIFTTLTKLPNKIVKSNIHTMKVQYDLIYTPANVEDFI